jgi:hypothetical protein
LLTDAIPAGGLWPWGLCAHSVFERSGNRFAKKTRQNKILDPRF